MLRKRLLSLLLAASCVAATQADTLLLDGIDMAQTTAGSRPARGVTMQTVESQFGAPTERVAAVGEPPISRWVYPTFTVFFEYDRVIHAVPRHEAP